MCRVSCGREAARPPVPTAVVWKEGAVAGERPSVLAGGERFRRGQGAKTAASQPSQRQRCETTWGGSPMHLNDILTDCTAVCMSYICIFSYFHIYVVYEVLLHTSTGAGVCARIYRRAAAAPASIESPLTQILLENAAGRKRSTKTQQHKCCN